jgi:hypothetical protein
MKHANRAVHFWMLAAFVVVVLAFGPAAHAQSGNPIIRNNSGSNVPDPIFIDAFEATSGSSADMCSRINTAWTGAVSATLASVVIDARGFTYANGPLVGGAWGCAASPFPSTSNAAGGKLLLGNVRILTSVTWKIPSRVHVEGLGVSALASGNSAYSANTIIQSNSTSADPVVQLGNGTGLTFDVQLKSLTVDAFGNASTGILNDSSQEGSTVEDVNIYNAFTTGLSIYAASSTVSPTNSGPYRNLNIQYNSSCPSSSCGTGTGGISVVNAFSGAGGIIRGIDNVTVSGGGTSGQSLGSCISIDGYPIQITNSHVEYCTTGIAIGSSNFDAPFTNNVVIQNVSTDPYSGYNITIDRANDVLLSNITGFGTQILKDDVTTNVITGTFGDPYFLGFYLLGDGTSPAVVSTTATISSGPNSPHLTWVDPGWLDIIGTISKGGGTFKIDDPVDPTNKYLYHSFVESPDMMNVYNGSVTTDKRGVATVILPDYFEALNKDFRYQLTPIGSFAQATVTKKVDGNRFTIRTSKPGVEVSWQVTGVRHDAYANAHRIQVEEEKPEKERGHLLHPELTSESGKLPSMGGESPR